jgi:tetratricopeptide (TPR) repeat protein
MGGLKPNFVVALAIAGATFLPCRDAIAGAGVGTPVAQESQQQETPSSSSSSSSSDKANRKSGSGAHHTRIVESEDPSPELTKAEALIQKDNLGEAETILRKLVVTDADNYVAWFDLGFVENGLGKPDDSIAAYRKSVAAKPDVFESNLNLGLQLAKSGQPEAEQFLRAATQLKPANHVNQGQARAWLALGHVLEAKALDKNAPPTALDEAVAAYLKAAALEPKDAEPHLSAGLVLENQKKFTDAEHEYKLALELDPGSADATIGLANVYMRARKFPEAEAALRKVVAARPQEAAVHIQLGRVLAAEGKNEDAITELEAALQSGGGTVHQASFNAGVQRDLADLYSLTGKNDKAEAAYRILLAGHPNDPILHHELGTSLLREKKFPEAQQELTIAVKLKPDFGEAYGDLAFAAGENKDYSLVVRALDARVKVLPEIPITYFLRASAYDHLLDVKKAVANYHLFLQTANGKYPDQEWQAKHRLIALEAKK